MSVNKTWLPLWGVQTTPGCSHPSGWIWEPEAGCWTGRTWSESRTEAGAPRASHSAQSHPDPENCDRTARTPDLDPPEHKQIKNKHIYLLGSIHPPLQEKKKYSRLQSWFDFKSFNSLCRPQQLNNIQGKHLSIQI